MELRRRRPSTSAATAAAAVVALLVLSSAGRCSAARRLAQDVHSTATNGNNPTSHNSLNLFAKAREAEARSNPMSSGLLQ